MTIDPDCRSATGLHVLRMTAYPPGDGPYERWELTVEATGEILLGGPWPIDHDAVEQACAEHHRRVEQGERAWAATRAAAASA